LPISLLTETATDASRIRGVRSGAPARGHRRRPTNSGFTLIEIIIAVLILASSLMILLGLQSATVRRAIQDRETQQAMLVAREIMSMIETVKDPALIQDASGTAEEVIKSVSGGAALPEDGIDPSGQFNVDLAIEKVPLPIIGDDRMTRLTLTLTWEGGPPQGLTLDYFIALEPT
jgi:prepilin-type N-terminal cleavage/methylation domain-containing protein